MWRKLISLNLVLILLLCMLPVGAYAEGEPASSPNEARDGVADSAGSNDAIIPEGGSQGEPTDEPAPASNGEGPTTEPGYEPAPTSNGDGVSTEPGVDPAPMSNEEGATVQTTVETTDTTNEDGSTTTVWTMSNEDGATVQTTVETTDTTNEDGSTTTVWTTTETAVTNADGSVTETVTETGTTDTDGGSAEIVAAQSSDSLTVDGIAVTCDKYCINGKYYFKLRDLACLLNGTSSQFDLGYDAENRAVTVVTQSAYASPNGSEPQIGADLSATACVSEQTLVIDGVPYTDLSVYNIGGSNYFQLDQLGEKIGFGVSFDTSSSTIRITTRSQQPNAVISGTCGANGDNLTWTLSDAGTLTISGTGAMADYDWNDSPWAQYNGQITSVVMGEGVTSVGTCAFQGCSMSQVSLPESLERIEPGAFYNCGNLTSLDIPAAVVSMESPIAVNGDALTAIHVDADNAFYSSVDGVLFNKDGTTLLCCPAAKAGTGYAVPEGTLAVQALAFRSCHFETVSIPASVTEIGDLAFIFCRGLSAITVDAGNPAFSSVDGVLFSKDGKTLRAFPAGKTSSYTIPDGVTDIGNGAFIQCNWLERVTIPDSVSTIGFDAFYGCFRLTDVYFGGTQAQWDAISIGTDNDPLTNATLHCAGSTGGTSNAGTCGDNLTWTLSDAGVLTVSGTGAMDDYDWDGGPWAQYNDQILYVVLEEGVTSVGGLAFERCGMRSVSLPESLIRIESSAFHNCGKLTSLDIPATVEYIGNAFVENDMALTAITVAADNESYCSVDGVLFSKDGKTLICCPAAKEGTGYAVPEGTLAIQRSAFRSCRFETLSIPASVTQIAFDAFSFFSAVKDVTVDAGNAVYSSADGVLFDKAGTTLLYFPAGRTGSYTVPADVTALGLYAFGNSNLEQVTLPDGLTVISTRAFNFAWNLKRITIPASVTSVANYAFFNCNLTDVYYGGTQAQWKAITVDVGNEPLANATVHCAPPALEIISQPTDFTAPVGATAKFTVVATGGDLTFFWEYRDVGGDWATDPANQTATASCTITDDNDGREYRCTVSDATGSVTSETATLHVGAAAIVASGTCGDNLTWTLDITGLLKISGTGEMEDYDWNGGPWVPYRDQISEAVIEPGVTCIGQSAFERCSMLTSVTIPASVTWLGMSAFLGCGRLTDLTIPASVTRIGVEAFFNNHSLKSVTIPASVTEIGTDAFGCCSSLTKVETDENNPAYQSMDGVLFSKDGKTLICCPAGKRGTYVIPEGVTRLGSCAFYGCWGLTSVTLPKSVCELGVDVFRYCTSLATVEADTNNLTYQSVDGVLYNKAGDTLVCCPAARTGAFVIPAGVKNIGDYALQSCQRLTSVTIPESVTYIGDWAFDGCGATDVYFRGTEEQWAQIEIVGWANGPLTDANIHFAGSCNDEYIARGECGAKGNNVTWTLDATGLLTISGTGAMADFDWNGGPWAQYNSQILSVVLEEGVTSVGANAFSNCLSLTSVTIPASVTRLEEEAFSWCRGLTELTIPGNVKYIGGNAFLFCTGLKSVTISEGVEAFGYYPFQRCTGLTSVMLPATLTEIESNPFLRCRSLNAISVAAGNPNFKSEDGVLFSRDGTRLVSFPGAKGGSYSIPDGVERIDFRAFSYCSALVSVTVPASVTDMEGNLDNCEALTAITVDAKNPNYKSESDVLLSKDGTQLLAYPAGKTDIGAYTVPNGVTRIGEWAFSSCNALTSVTIPDSVTSIGYGAFRDCSQLTEVSYGGTEEQWAEIDIENNNDQLTGATIRCSNIRQPKDTTVPEDETAVFSVEVVGEVQSYQWQCWSESGQTWVNLSNSGDCEGVTTNRLTVKALAACSGFQYRCAVTTDEGTVYSNAATLTVSDEDWAYVIIDGEATVMGYIGTDRDVIIPSRLGGAPVRIIRESAFRQCSTLTSLTIPSGVRRIEDWAVADCHALTQLVISDGVTEIGSHAFSYCDKLAQVTIPASVSDIGVNPFTGCCRLTAITVDAGSSGFKSIDGVLFSKDGTALLVYPAGKGGSYTVPEGVAALRAEAFFGCPGLTDVTLPAGLTTMEDNAFRGSAALLSISVASGNSSFKSVDGVLFSADGFRLIAYPGAKSGAYTVPDGVKSIEVFAFEWCDGLTKIALPDSVTEIKDGAFYGCGGLTSVLIPDTVTSIGYSAFCDCGALKNVTIPSSVTIIGEYAFNGCNRLTDVYFGGTQAQWNTITVGMGNGPLANVTVHCAIPTLEIISQPTDFTAPVGATAKFTVVATGGDLTFFWEYRDVGGNWVADPANQTATASCTITEANDGREYRCTVSDATGSVTSETATLHVGAAAIVASGTCGDNLTWTLDVTGLLTISGTGQMYDYDWENDASTAPWSGYAEQILALTVQEGVTRIGSEAFDSFPALISVSLPKSLEQIGDWAFFGCDELASVTIPENVTEIGYQAFSFTDSLTGFAVDGDNPVFQSIDGVLFSRDGRTLWAFPGGKTGSYVIPAGVTNIADCAFSTGNLTGVTLPDGISQIGNSAFFSCAALRSVEVPSSVTSIGDWAFESCLSLTDVYYKGTLAQWEAITVGKHNVPLTSATLHCAPPALEIISQPTDCSGRIGATATFTVVATGGDLTFFWEYRDVGGDWVEDTANQTATASCQIEASMAGREYRCTVSDATGSVSSEAATLHVIYGGETEITAAENVTLDGAAACRAYIGCEAGKAATAYAARYDANNRFIGLETMALTPGEVNAFIVLRDGANTVRFFVLADGSSAPLCAAVDAPDEPQVEDDAASTDLRYVTATYQKAVALDRGMAIYHYAVTYNMAGEVEDVVYGVDDTYSAVAGAYSVATLVSGEHLAAPFLVNVVPEGATTAAGKLGVRVALVPVNNGDGFEKNAAGVNTLFAVQGALGEITAASKSVIVGTVKCYLDSATTYVFDKSYGAAISTDADIKFGTVNFTFAAVTTWAIYKVGADGNPILKTVFYPAKYVDTGFYAKDAIYFSGDGVAANAVGSDATGFTYTAYNVSTGEKTTIKLKVVVGPADEGCGFYKYKVDADGYTTSLDYLVMDDATVFYDQLYKGFYNTALHVGAYDIEADTAVILDLRSAANKAVYTGDVGTSRDLGTASRAGYDIKFDLFATMDANTGAKTATIIILKEITAKA